MNSDKTRNISRVVYVDPTDIPNSNGNYSGAINFPYEDYCMSVDLSVIITNRYSCGWAKTNGEYKELNFSSRNGSLSFLGGSKISNSSDSFLTTNFTDISMTSPSDNTSECLGIESISISYGQWMFPQVVIKFIDVRGATVMQPSEYNYYNTQEKGISSDLYKSLFTYPYPMFNLTIKGFYGKSVTYKLAVQKTDLEFDNENGNFIIIATFIGYMYGIYAELPMTYIAAAPYMEAGKKYWDEKISDGTFWFKNSSGLNFSPMKTIPQLSNIIAAASKNEKVISAASEHKEVINRSDDKLNKLTEIEDAYPFNDWIFEDGFFIYLTTSYINDILIVRQKIEKFLTTLKEYDKKYHDNNYFYDEFSELEKYCPQINSVQYYVDTIHIRNIDMFTEFQYNNGVFQQKTEEQPLKLIENETVKNFIYSKQFVVKMK